MSKGVLTIVVFAAAALDARPLEAKKKTVAGNWTLTIEHFPLRFVLDQKGSDVTGRLDYPHGAPIPLKGTFRKETLTFSGDSKSAENFTIHVDATGAFESDGSLSGTLKAHFIEFNDAGDVVRTRDQVMMWTAERAPQK